MQVEIFRFTKTERNPSTIEDSINKFLKTKSFKFATMSELNGKFVISVYYSKEDKNNIQCKVFKDQIVQNLEESVNKFLKKNDQMRMSLQESAGGSVYSILFYESGKTNGTAKKEKNENKG